MSYNNSMYWTEIHKEFADQLRAVGWPWLSEEYNKLMYQSQSETLLDILIILREHFQDKKTISTMDVGTGTGYWSALIRNWLVNEGFKVAVSALDISKEALQAIKERDPDIQLINADLKVIDTYLFSGQYDLVTAFYCLHHLVNLDEFLNGLRFTGRSVKNDGILIIADPILTRSYSTFDTFDFATYANNGVPRHLYLLDDILLKEGFKRLLIRPAVSFLFSGNIEGDGRWQYNFYNFIFMKLHNNFYKSEKRTKFVSGTVTKLDRSLKQHNRGFSASICVYKRTT